ncbi:MAG TPA: NAD(P)/FAD-dependent oxidoreductase [Bacteroidales bacterium]
MRSNIPESDNKRLIIVGGGFAGLKLATKLSGSNYQVVLIDRNNFHQFQPLLYQVATSGLEPSTISFPLRKIFQKSKNVIIRIAEVTAIDREKKEILTNLGSISYDYLVIAVGAGTNFFGMNHIREKAIPMKSVAEALSLRNTLLQNLEDALNMQSADDLEGLMNIVVVGGGPTGVEISGTLAEMKRSVLPKDYPELNFSNMQIFLLEAGSKLLNGMTDRSSAKAMQYLEKLGVKIWLNSQVSDFDGKIVTIHNGKEIRTNTLVWAAGVTGNRIEGLPEEAIKRGNRIKVDRFNRVEGCEGIFALGDIAFMQEDAYPNGHPQMAQPAIQQALLLSRNIKRIEKGENPKPYSYFNKGAMATIGRNLAVVDLPFLSFHGFFAWLVWMFVHLMAIVGVKNRLMIFINWFWNYITYDQSLRLIIKPYQKGNSQS